ncbi:hypothetical protein BH11PSE1_BH11PSE1_23720 [soil metagenome]
MEPGAPAAHNRGVASLFEALFGNRLSDVMI